jgi:NAD-dependent deacetylase
MIDIDQSLINNLRKALSLVFFTGAGISAESGIPTFRGENGIWNKLKPEELANFDAFMRNPQMVWEWYNHRKKVIHESKPNAAHLTIAEFQNHFEEVTVVTQNIDNFHRRAGSRRIFELHGNIERNYCVYCKTYYNEELEFKDGIPRCKCGGLIRPDVVWFGEYLPEYEFEEGEKASMNADIFFIVGTSAIVYPAAGLIQSAKRGGATLVEVNLTRTEISSFVDYSFTGKAGEVMPVILEKYKTSVNN